jgi:hypothetical protein
LARYQLRYDRLPCRRDQCRGSSGKKGEASRRNGVARPAQTSSSRPRSPLLHLDGDGGDGDLYIGQCSGSRTNEHRQRGRNLHQATTRGPD